MAIRTNADAVQLVLSTSLTEGQITQFIADASLWVDEELVGLTDFVFSTDRLELIERYLACALIRIRDLGLRSASFEDVREQYQVDDKVTEYLTRAAAFDPTGKIRSTFLAPTHTRSVRTWRGSTFKEEFRTPLDSTDG